VRHYCFERFLKEIILIRRKEIPFLQTYYFWKPMKLGKQDSRPGLKEMPITKDIGIRSYRMPYCSGFPPTSKVGFYH